MTDTQTPDNWVLIEAAKRCGWTGDVPLFQTYYENDRPYRALCDMIAKHEQKPIDRELLCACEAVESADMSELEWDSITAAAACIRAIELWEEGFGK